MRFARLAVLVVSLASAASASAQEDAPTTRPARPFELIRDDEDGALDMSDFLATRIGFMPLAMPITEPAVGYGLAGGLLFLHEKPRVYETPNGPRLILPKLTMIGGLGTENGSWGAFAGHLHTWRDGRIRYLVGGGYASLNLDWFGQSDAFQGRAFSYNIEAAALIQKLTLKLGNSDFYFGPTQKLISTNSEFDFNTDLPAAGAGLGIVDNELQSTISGLGLTLVYDTRNSLYSPTQGTKAHISWTQNDEVIGSDFDYGRIDAEVCQYLPLVGPFTLGLRGAISFSGDDAPFYDLPAINLRGIQAGRYVDNVATTLEAEIRWDLTRRWTVVGFGGVGWAADKFDELDDADEHWAGGAGFRYLIARKYDMRLGCDIARGPEDWTFYVTVGTGWLRD